MKTHIFATCVLAALSIQAASIDRVIVRQQWPWSGKVKIEYILSGATAGQNVTVNLYDGDKPVDVSGLGTDFFTGELYGVGDGIHTITMDADRLALTAAKPLRIDLALSETPAGDIEPIYMIVDLVTPSNITYVCKADLMNGLYGAYETDYSKVGPGFNVPAGCEDDVILWTGVTNDIKYMTTHMVFRKIPAANQVLTLGRPLAYQGSHPLRTKEHTVKLTSDYWIGVFEVTQAQFSHFGTISFYFNNPDYAATRPVDRAYYRLLRGSTKGIQWKEGVTIDVARQVDANTWMDIARKHTGLDRLDLPTDAQWEIAAAALSTTEVYSGKPLEHGSSPNGYTRDASYNELARYKWNGGYTNAWGDAAYPAPAQDCTTQFGTAKVGSYAPNAYGLYDVLGNVDELVLDFLREDLTKDKDGNDAVQPLVNPKGGTGVNTAQENPRRSLRGGRWDTALNGGFSIQWRAVLYDTGTANGIGFRLCYTETDED